MTEPDDGAGLPITERMQELLARAAEDQLSEQRQLAEALTELRAQMDHITADLSALRATDRGERVDTAVGSVSAEVREAVRLIGERLDGLARMVHQRGLDLAELRGSFAELRNHVTAHGEALSGLTGGLDSIPSYGERVAALQESVSVLSDRLGGLDDVRTAVFELDHRVGMTADALADVRRSLDALREESGGVPGAGEFEATAAQVAALSHRIDELSATTAPLAERLMSMQESLMLEAERNARLADQLTTLGMRLDAVADNATTARTDSEGLSRRLDLLQEDVTAIGSNVAGLVEGGPDRAEIAAALEAARSAGDQIGQVNEMAVQVAEVRAALLGDDGLEAQVAALTKRISSGGGGEVVAVADDVVQATVTETVKREVAASEARLAEHLDEAVLALAEVLLRRRSRAGAALSRSALGDFWAPTEAESGLLTEPGVSGLPDVESGPSGVPDAEAGPSGVSDAEAGVPGLADDEPGPSDLPGLPDAEPDAEALGFGDLEPGDAGLIAMGYEESVEDVPASYAQGGVVDLSEASGATSFDEAPLDTGEETDLAGAVEGAEAAEPDATGWLDETDLLEESDDDMESDEELQAPWDVERSAGDEDFRSQPGDDDEIGRLDLARAAAEASAAIGGRADDTDLSEAATPIDDGDWSATVQSEVKVESGRRKRRPWWRPGD